MSFAAASTLACGVRPDRIWIRPTRKLEALLVPIRVLSGREQRVELAGTIERVELVAAADVSRSDENLRGRHPSVRAADHFGAALRLPRHVDFLKGHSLAAQQILRPRTIRAIRSRINH